MSVGEQIKTKEMEVITEVVLRKWTAVLGGRMDCLHSDRGKEFNKTLLSDLAEYLRVRTTLTAAFSPHQNGINEPNHAICDSMIHILSDFVSQLAAKSKYNSEDFSEYF